MNPWNGLLELPRRIWLLCACTLVNRMGTMAFPFLTLYLVQGRHWPPRAAATALLVYGAGGLLAAPFSGKLADRLGHNRVLQASLWGSGALLLALPLAGSGPVLSAVIFLWAVLTQAFWPSSMALLSGLAPPGQRRAVFALHRVASNLGMAVGPALGGFIAMASFRWVFWTDGLTTLLSAALLARFLSPGEPRAAAAPAGGERGGPAWSDRRLVLLLLAFLPVLLAFWQVSGVLPLWVVRDLGFGSTFFGLIWTLNTLLIVLLEVPLNHAMARWPHRRQFALGALLVAAGFGLTGLARGRPALLLTVAVWTFGEMILFPATADAVAALAPRQRRGEYMGLYSLAFAAANGLGPWLGVLAYAHLGAGPVWAGCLLLGCASAAALARFHPAGPGNP